MENTKDGNQEFTRFLKENRELIKKFLNIIKTQKQFKKAKKISLDKIAEELNMEKGELITQMETARKALEKANYSFVTAGGLSKLFDYIDIEGLKKNSKKRKKGK